MAQTVPALAELGPAYTGDPIGYRILNLDKTTYSAFTVTGVVEDPDIPGNFEVTDGVIAPDAGGYIKWGISGTDYAGDDIAPAPALAADYTSARAVKLDNLDATVSSRASQTSVDTIDDFLDTEIAAILAAVDTEVAAILADTNELQTDWTNGGRLDLLIDAIKVVTDALPEGGALTTLLANVAAALADTNELQTDWANGGRLDLILDARASQTSVDTIDDFLDTEIAAILAAVDTEVAAIKAKTDNLPTDPADASDIATSFSTLTAKLRKYVQLLARKDSAIATDNSTEVTEINADGGSGGGSFANTTDSQEAIRDRGDAAWITAVVSGLATQASVDTIDGIVDSILVDTNELQVDWTNGGRLDLLVDAILADTNELQTDWVNGGRLDLLIDAIKAVTDALPEGGALTTLLGNVTSILADTNELQTDWTNGGRLDLLIDAIKAVTDALPEGGALTTLLANVAAALADTNELQTDWVNGGRLDLILDARASQASVDAIDTIVDAILADTGTDGVAVASAAITAIAEAVLKQGVEAVEDTADEYSLAAVILGMFNSTIPEGGPWTIIKVGGGTFVVRTVTEAAVTTAVTGVE